MIWDGQTFPEFKQNCSSLLSRYLSKDLFNNLKNKKTLHGFTLFQAINSGVVNQDSHIGVYAGDAESYDLFSPLLNPIIDEYHGFSLASTHTSDFNSSAPSVPNPDPNGQYILSTRIRVGRNIDGMPLGPAINRDQRIEVESRIARTLDSLSGDLSGTYFPLLGMDEIVQNRLISDHFLFKNGDRFLEAVGLNRDWPEGRGIFHNQQKTFLVWVNEEDQLRIISMQKGGDISAVFNRLIRAVKKLEETLPFLFHSRLGYLSSCPTNLGTAMRASVHIQLLKLGSKKSEFEDIADRYSLQIRGIHGEHSESEGGVFDVSNRKRLGITEIEAIRDLYDGVVALIKKEATL